MDTSMGVCEDATVFSVSSLKEYLLPTGAKVKKVAVYLSTTAETKSAAPPPSNTLPAPSVEATKFCLAVDNEVIVVIVPLDVYLFTTAESEVVPPPPNNTLPAPSVETAKFCLAADNAVIVVIVPL